MSTGWDEGPFELFLDGRGSQIGEDHTHVVAFLLSGPEERVAQHLSGRRARMGVLVKKVADELLCQNVFIQQIKTISRRQ